MKPRAAVFDFAARTGWRAAVSFFYRSLPA
jgi:hypothetical protein